ncbi:MAG: class I SAM-dependent methyltransferase [Desulfobulbaceae bacterium]|uniref:Ribosomal RNA small subunit methyltransferase J n=1 Tax=Candidatus Desulfobia pelagia TaxID=2841692 RepID=A0A8J6NG42_9BACT|nr:class I SAM-dependent methyltransferase [Candidatus Desulfobia pelagia]
MDYYKPDIAVFCEAEQRQSEAAELALSLGLPFTVTAGGYAMLLVLTPERLELRQSGPGAPGGIAVDFASGLLRFRRLYGGGRKQPLAKAIGLKHNLCPTILDATAGLGRDSFILAALGCTVQMIERSKIIAALLQDGLDRAKQNPAINTITGRMTLVAENSIMLPPLPQQPDVIYLDPMYPHRTKSALVKKEMRLLRAVVGDDTDAPSLLEWALSQQKERVVVKRPKGAPDIDGPPPTFVIKSKNSRFDVYK